MGFSGISKQVDDRCNETKLFDRSLLTGQLLSWADNMKPPSYPCRGRASTCSPYGNIMPIYNNFCSQYLILVSILLHFSLAGHVLTSSSFQQIQGHALKCTTCVLLDRYIVRVRSHCSHNRFNSSCRGHFALIT